MSIKFTWKFLASFFSGERFVICATCIAKMDLNKDHTIGGTSTRGQDIAVTTQVEL